MSFKTLPTPLFWGRPPFLFAAVTGVANGVDLIDASGEKVAYIIKIRKAGNIRKVYFRMGAVTTARDIKVSLQDVDASGDADGVVDQYRVVATASVAATTGILTGIVSSDGTDLGSLRAVTPGQVLAVVFEFDSLVGNLEIQRLGGTAAATTAIPYTELFTTVWTKSATPPVLALEYDDGTYTPLDGVYPFVGGIPTVTFNSGTAGADEHGNRFVLPFNARVSGLWAHVDYDNAADLVLYSGTTSLATEAFPAAAIRPANTAGLIHLPLASAVDVVANTVYRVSVKPGASSVILRGAGVGAAAVLGAYYGTDFYSTSRLDAGAWADDATLVQFCGPVITHIGGGGGQLVNGGLVG